MLVRPSRFGATGQLLAMAIVCRDRSAPGGGFDGSLAPQGHLIVIFDRGGNRWFGRDPKLDSLVRLPPPPLQERWSVDYTDDGFAYIESESESHWLSSFFENCL